MKAIVYSQHGLPIQDPRSLFETELPKPEPGPRDLLVKIRAIAVNPVDTKVRSGLADRYAARARLGCRGDSRDRRCGRNAFQARRRGVLCGLVTRPGAYAEYGLVDERIAGHKPATLDDVHSAALPLTSLTAWELLFDRLGVAEGEGDGDALLIVGAAGGVGSVLTFNSRGN